jgi:xanthine dehydrogenase YagT iron-sulfur-binding subunit
MAEKEKDLQGSGLTRRGFLSGSAVTAVAPLALGLAHGQAAEIAPSDPRQPVTVSLTINGRPQQLMLDGRTSLLDALRLHAGLTGTKKGCDHGQCGACSVLVDGQRQLSCMSFAVMMEGRDIQTIEGLADQVGELHPMQQAFIDHDAFQCGYCTPGQIMSAIGCVNEGHAETDDDIREYMSGNLCRCAAYPNIVAAIRQARDQMKEA